METETWVITPITSTMILIFIGIPILCVFAGLDALFNFIHNHISVIIIVGIVIAAICTCLTIIFSKKLLFLLAILSNALVLSQFFFMLVHGSQAIYVMEQDYLAAFWRLIVFAIWLVYMLLNLAVCLVGMGAGPVLAIANIKEKSNDDSLIILSMIACAAAGGIGWIINWLFI